VACESPSPRPSGYRGSRRCHGAIQGGQKTPQSASIGAVE
jgi:hypothetical protein